jgi:hypothetical protein
MTTDAADGWVEVEPSAPYLRRNGKRWFPSGWCSIRPDRLNPARLARMAAAGCDTVRLWPDHNESGQLTGNFAELVDAAGKLGMSCSVTLLNLGELSDTFIDEPNLKRVPNAYRDLCETPAELLTSPAARDLSKARIEACLDVVGDSPAVYQWIVCSQIDSIYQVPLDVLDDFTSEMAGFLAKEEQRRLGRTRLRTLTSFDALPIGDTYYRSPDLDLVGLHLYTPSVYTPVDALQPAWEVAHATASAARTGLPGRPVHGLEYGPIQHQFVDDSPPLPAELLRRYRRSTAFAHLCAGAAGGPLIVPSTPYRNGADGEELTGVTDQVRAIPNAIRPELTDEESSFRRVVDDPAFGELDGRWAGVAEDDGMLRAGCGSPSGSSAFWVAADTRFAERAEWMQRALDGDAQVPALLGYDAALALAGAVAAPVCNPVGRMLAGKLTAQGRHEVAQARIRAETAKLHRLIRVTGVPEKPATLAGRRLGLPEPGPARPYRCYDTATGELVAEGRTAAEVVLPDVAEAVVVLDPAR